MKTSLSPFSPDFCLREHGGACKAAFYAHFTDLQARPQVTFMARYQLFPPAHYSGNGIADQT